MDGIPWEEGAISGSYKRAQAEASKTLSKEPSSDLDPHEA